MIQLPLNTNIADKHYDLVKDSIVKQIDKAVNSGIILKGRKIPSPTEQVFLSHLKNNKLLKTLITAEPVKLRRIIKIFLGFSPRITNPSNPINRILYSIFVNNGYNMIDKWDFINKIEIDTCPYCNRNYVYSLSNKSRIKPEIDHFFPKSQYPFLGASFYNLIPSCQTCNGFGAKGKIDPIKEKLYSPYEIKPDDFEFTFKLNRIDFNSPLEGNSKILVHLKKKIDGNDRVFKLSKLYEKHEDHVIELIVKSKLEYSDKYRLYLNSYIGMKFSDSEINRLIIGNYAELGNLHKRPLAKLYRDISKKLKLIE